MQVTASDKRPPEFASEHLEIKGSDPESVCGRFNKAALRQSVGDEGEILGVLPAKGTPEFSVRRRLVRALSFYCLGPPGEVVGKTGKSSRKGIASAPERFIVSVQCCRDTGDGKGA